MIEKQLPLNKMPEILKIVKYPNKILSTKTKIVEEINNDILTLIDNMIATMYENNGIGLAANQVNVSLRVTVIDTEWKREEDKIVNKNPIALINPQIIEKSTETSVYSEGCLSLPNIHEEIERSKTVTVEFLNKEGNKEVIKADGILATCLQHEIDHLDGKMFIDYLSKLKKHFVLKKYKKLQA